MFINAWAMMIGAVAVGLPITIHLLTKPRPTRMPLSTIRFVREAVRQRRARHRLRDVIILLLRTCAILLVATAIARPRLGQQPLISDSQTGDTVRVVILDASQSMAATTRGVGAIERGRSIAASHLRYRSGLRVGLIVSGARPRSIFDEPSTNFEALRDDLANVTVLPERFDVNRSIDLAAKMLAPRSENDRRRRELVIISDFQRSNWTRADFAALPEDTKIQFESVASKETPSNLAVLNARVQGRSAISATTTLEVEIGNYSPTPQSVSVEVILGDATYRLEGTCAAGRRTTLSEEIQWREAGWKWGQARLVDVTDALDADNRLPIVVNVQSKPTYSLITRQSPNQRPSSSHFLECALIPDAPFGDRASARLIRIDPSAVDRESIAAADLIVIDHPGKLDAETISLLSGLLRRGHPIVYIASEIIDATNLRRLTEAAGTGLQMPVDFAPPPRGQTRRDLFLASFDNDSPSFQVFGDSTSAMVSRLRFAGGLSSQTRPGALLDDVLATYNDGTACLVVTSSDVGTLAVINADLGKSNLPTSADVFVPLLHELVQQLLQSGAGTETSECGEPLVSRLNLTAENASQLRIVAPGESGKEVRSDLGELVDDGKGVVWRWQMPNAPGVYQIQKDNKTRFAIPIVTSNEESNLESLSADVLQDRLAAGRTVYFQSLEKSGSKRDTTWVWLLAACVVCLLGEVFALTMFRS